MSRGKSIDFEEQYDRIYRYCYFKVHRQEVAEDITQETFLRFWEHYGYQGKEWDLRYLYRIAHNLCVDEYRKKTTEQFLDDMAEESHEDRVLTRIMVKNALSALSEEEQEMLLLRYVNEVPVSVICKLFSISRYALYRKLKKALKTLQKEYSSSNRQLMNGHDTTVSKD